ncbi:MAG: hypothetical protein HOY76_30805, partial [Streptomyces sp.]|nr:hypothetical protein [Streptomyces sp.]
GSGRPVPPPSTPAGLAAAVLLGRPGAEAAVSIRSAEPYDADHATHGEAVDTEAVDTEAPGHPGNILGLFDLAAAHRRLLRDGGSHLLVTEPGARGGRTAFRLTADTETPPGAPTDAHAVRDDRETHAHH